MDTNLLEVSKNTQIEFKNQEAKRNWRQWCWLYSASPRTMKMVKFASAWLKSMQFLMSRRNELTLETVDEAYRSCIVEYEISPLVINDIKDKISQCWKYGCEFKSLIH